jgi:predicted nucleotidyltransferase
MHPWGLEERHWREMKELAVWPLQRAGCTVSIFGSRARGDQAKFSDVDILIEGPATRSQLSSIAEQLEESTLAVQVDLVLFQDLAESYRDGLLRDRVVLPIEGGIAKG